MSFDEFIVGVAAGVVGLWLWTSWYWNAMSPPSRFSSFLDRAPLLLTPPLCAALLFLILRRFASFDVREDSGYLAFYHQYGAGWGGVGQKALAWCGLRARDDLVERGNAAVAPCISGALLGLTLCFAGANMGDGPGWWVVLFSGLLSTGAFFGLWLGQERLTRVSEFITVDRDEASGWRQGGLFVGWGLILGRAAAGNWVSIEATFGDFIAIGGPAVPLAVLAVLLDKLFAPNRQQASHPILTHGICPALLYVGGAAYYLWWRGPW